MAFQMLAMQQLSAFGLMCLLLLSTYTILIRLTLMGLILWYMLMFFNTAGTLYSAGSIMGADQVGFLPESRGVLFFSDLFTKMSMYQYPMFVAAIYEIYHYQNTGSKNYYIMNINITDPGKTGTGTPSTSKLQSQTNSKEGHMPYTAASASEKFFHSLQGPVILHSFWCEVAIMVVSDLVNGGVIEERTALYLFILDHIIHYASAMIHLSMSLRPFLPPLSSVLNDANDNISSSNSSSIFESIYTNFLFYIPQTPSTFTCVSGAVAGLAMMYSVHINPVLLQEFGGPTRSLRKYLFGMRIAQIFQAATLVSLIS